MGFILNPYRHASVLVYDTFTDTTGTDLTAHTPDVDSVGGGWVYGTASTEAQIDTGEVKPITIPGTEPNGLVYIETNAADVVIVSNLTINSTVVTRLICRYVDTNNFWLIQNRDVANGFQLYERSGGVYTKRGETAGSSSGSVTVTIELSGTSISTYATGTSTLNWTSSSHQSATKHGIGLKDASNRWTDFAVTDNSA